MNIQIRHKFSFILFTSGYAPRGLLRVGVDPPFLGLNLGRVMVPLPKIVVNLPRNYEKLPCKEDPYQFSGYRDPSPQTK